MEKIQNAIQSLASLLIREGEDFVVGGSLALKKCGIDLGREIGDIDIIVKKDCCADKIFKTLQSATTCIDEMNNVIKQNEYPENMYTFYWKQVKVNVIKENRLPDYVSIGFIKYAKANEVFSAKKRYGREKDLKDIQKIIKWLTE